MSGKVSTPFPSTAPGRFARYGARVLDDPLHDPYHPRGKYADGTGCGECGAIYRGGRWQWPAKGGDAKGDAVTSTASCPACRRAHDRLPAGHLTIGGAYFAAHRADIMAVVRHQADDERAERPMHRVMGIVERDGAVEIATTDIHLPRRIGEALQRAHDGDLEIAFGEDAYEIRVRWRR